MNVYDDIYNDAFNDELEKVAISSKLLRRASALKGKGLIRPLRHSNPDSVRRFSHIAEDYTDGVLGRKALQNARRGARMNNIDELARRNLGM